MQNNLSGLFILLLLYKTTFVPAKKLEIHDSLEYLSSETILKEGKDNYELILRDSRMPKYGKCWKNALKELVSGCRHLNDDIQSRLALNFANCFLLKAGFNTYPCDDNSDITKCLRSMDNNGFTAYTNFFTHTQSMCYFLQSQVWHEETEHTIGRLAEHSSKVSQKLESSHELQQAILVAQKLSLEQQEQLIERSSSLGQALDISRESVRTMMEEFRSSTDEQRNLLFEVFERLAKLQNLVLGEVTGFYSLIFYPTAILVIYLLTSTARTSAARFWLFAILGCSLSVERMVTSITIQNLDGYLPVNQASEELYWRIWLIRKATMIVCGIVLVYNACKFQDYNLINNALLRDIQRQNEELKAYFETIGHGEVKGGKILPSLFSEQKRSGIIDTDASDSDLSCDSKASDHTYIPRYWSSDSESSDNSFETAISLPVNISNDHSTQFHRKSNDHLFENNTSMSKRSNDAKANNSVVSRYNLRSRSKESTQHNPLVNQESPEAFSKIVKKMEKITKRHATQFLNSVRIMPKSSYFSSDDD